MPKAARGARVHKVWPDSPAEQPAIIETSEAPNQDAAPAPEIARPAAKKKRVPVGLRNPMAVDEKDLDPNFSYRFVRNTPGRVQKFIEGGYEMVTGDARIGDPNIAKASNMGSAFSIASGDNEDRVYLMRIPKTFYEEDQAAKAAKVDAIEEHLKRKPKTEGLEGKIDLTR